MRWFRRLFAGVARQRPGFTLSSFHVGFVAKSGTGTGFLPPTSVRFCQFYDRNSVFPFICLSTNYSPNHLSWYHRSHFTASLYLNQTYPFAIKNFVGDFLSDYPVNIYCSRLQLTSVLFFFCFLFLFYTRDPSESWLLIVKFGWTFTVPFLSVKHSSERHVHIGSAAWWLHQEQFGMN